MQERDRAIPGEAEEEQGCLREVCQADSSPPGAILPARPWGRTGHPTGKRVGRKGRAENSYTC